MLTDIALRNLKPKSLTYKASDRDGMCVTVSPSGTVTFRYDYRLNGRRETHQAEPEIPSGTDSRVIGIITIRFFNSSDRMATKQAACIEMRDE